MVVKRPRGSFGTLDIARRPSNPNGATPDAMRYVDAPDEASPLIKTYRIRTPVAIAANNGWTVISPNEIAAPLSAISNLPFAPAAVQILNYSEQALRMVYNASTIGDIVNGYDVSCPPRYYVADAIDPVESNPSGVVIALYGGTATSKRLIIIRFYSQPVITFGVNQLPSDIQPPDNISRVFTPYEGALNVATGATVILNPAPCNSLVIANDDAANSITFAITDKYAADGITPDFTGTTQATLKAGDPHLGIDIEAVGIKFANTGNASAYRVWALS